MEYDLYPLELALLTFNTHGIKRSRTKICEKYAMGWEGNKPISVMGEIYIYIILSSFKRIRDP